MAQYLSLRPAFLAHARLRYHGLSEGPETFAQRLRKRTMDVLSEILKVVKLKGALFYNGEFSSPWSVRAASSRGLANHFKAGVAHVIVYHLVTEGRAFIRLDSGQHVTLNAGDLVMIPHGDPHIMENGSATQTVDDSKQLGEVLAQGMKLWRLGGGGEVTRVVCGYMACDPRLSQVFLSGLPPLLKISIRNDASGQWLEESIRFSVDQTLGCRAGGEAVLSKLAEVLFVEALRAYITSLPPEQTGWLAGARDAEVSKALALMHERPADPWTIATLAQAAGVSRSVLAERFRHFLGEPPMAYLMRWRLQLGAERLISTNHSVAQVGSEVGYESEAAFNRAFKREFTLPPARFRTKARSSANPGSSEKIRARPGW